MRFRLAIRDPTATLAPDALVAAIAATQHGVVAHAQLLGAGLNRAAIERRVKSRRLFRVHAGVYAVGHPGITGDGRRLAAVLAGGPSALLAYRAAGAAYEILDFDFRGLEVLTPDLGRRTVPGVNLRHSRVLVASDRHVLRGIPITSVGRTLVDLATCLPRRSLREAVHEAQVKKLLDRDALLDTLSRASRRRGSGYLRQLVADLPQGDLRSRMEQLFARFCRRFDLPVPEFNALLDLGTRKIRADGWYAEVGLVVELDSRGFHGTEIAFDDRARDGDTLAAGLRVVRYTWRQLKHDPAATAARHRAILTRLGHPALTQR